MIAKRVEKWWNVFFRLLVPSLLSTFVALNNTHSNI